jgi:hypothetical protein
MRNRIIKVDDGFKCPSITTIRFEVIAPFQAFPLIDLGSRETAEV